MKFSASRTGNSGKYVFGTRCLGLFLLVSIALGAWIYAFPKGAEPDGAFHLASTWCGSGFKDGQCEPATNYEGLELNGVVKVPGPIARDYGNSDTSSLNNKMIATHRYNSSSLYPKGFYWITSRFVQSDVEQTVLILRWINAALFALCVLSAHYLLPGNMKKGFGLTVLVLLMPLGIFTVVSNNPSSWTTTGIATYWAFLFAFLTEVDSRRTKLAGVFALFSTLIALSSRGDSGGYLVLSSFAVVAIVYARKGVQLRALIKRLWLPVGIILLSVGSFFTASQNKALVTGFVANKGVPGRDPAKVVGIGFLDLIYNLTKLPGVFAGFFGLEGTNGFLGGTMAFTMPEIVSLGMMFLFATLITNSSFERSRLEKATFLIFSFAVAFLPVIVMNRTGELFPGLFQSRYVLPIAIPLVGLFMAGSQIESKMSTSRMTKNMVFVILISSYFVSLHTSMRKFVLPANSIGLNLNQSRLWWRQGVPSPMVILFLGTLSYVTLVYVFVYGNRKLPALFKVVAGKNR